MPQPYNGTEFLYIIHSYFCNCAKQMSFINCFMSLMISKSIFLVIYVYVFKCVVILYEMAKHF